mmetsp:Transcript_34335/g.67625  ORF Transcript_34335/g.67625 Transcript_34335/m.67625 type:complete len:250 (+) Transcript_34335:177-926(+)
MAEEYGWPTDEMSGRGTRWNLVVGVMIAIPSGVGVALGKIETKGGGISSLIGVAISASLLPPAVNCGVLWAYSLFGGIPQFMGDQVLLTPQQRYDYFVMGGLSLSLTLVNVACILISAYLMFRWKLYKMAKPFYRHLTYDMQYQNAITKDEGKELQKQVKELMSPTSPSNTISNRPPEGSAHIRFDKLGQIFEHHPTVKDLHALTVSSSQRSNHELTIADVIAARSLHRSRQEVRSPLRHDFFEAPDVH